ncbi:MAG: glycine reductase [Clostridia bacterium]|nr:glycine reductase [Clostridia bacterium]
MDNQSMRNMIGDIFEELARGLETGAFGQRTRVGLTILGSEHGPEELVRGAELAQQQNPDLEVVVIGHGVETSLELIPAQDEKEAHAIMDQMLEKQSLDAAVTMHYSFPIGVSTVGRVITPGKGKELFLATTTGTSATERVTAMLKNTLYGIAVAKACGKEKPTVGILNIDGARQVERVLKKLQEQGYPIHFAESARSDGGVVMRGNDLLLGVPDVMVMDSLTGNVLMKMFSAYMSGGSYEALGYGYGPGVGENYDRIICIISRASGAPVIAGAIRFAGECAKGKLMAKAAGEFAAAKKAGLDELLNTLACPAEVSKKAAEEVAPPPAKPVTAEIPGIEILELEDAVQLLWKEGIYAQSGMGCTGPIVMVAPEDKDKAVELLKEGNYL